MTGADELVAKRLRTIAHASHWRNVFLFAAGRCSHERQHLRDTLYTLCCEHNEGEGIEDGGALESATLAGSRLALEILEDGAVVRQPAQLKLYARPATRLMELPPCDEQLRLARQYRPGLEDVFRHEIQERLGDSLAERRLGGWRVLLHLVGTGEEWARGMAEGQWPGEAKDALVVIREAQDVEAGE